MQSLLICIFFFLALLRVFLLVLQVTNHEECTDIEQGILVYSLLLLIFQFLEYAEPLS